MPSRRYFLLLLALVGCGGDGSLPPLSLRLALDGDPGRGACAARQCDAYPLDCGALLGVRVVDPGAAPEAPALEEHCLEVPPAANLCALDQVELDLRLPTRRVLVEVGLWHPTAMGEQRSCPRTSIFDLRGLPRENFLPQPAFGGAAYLDLSNGRDREGLVRLACTGPDQLGRSHCPAAVTRVSVVATDLENSVGIAPAVARTLDVDIGMPRQQSGAGGGEPRWVISSSRKLTLEAGGTSPLFTGTLEPGMLEPTLCAQLQEEVPQAVATVTCAGIDPDAADLRIVAHHLAKSVLDQILTAMGLGGGFPPSGLVVGRVIDDTGAGLAGVTVTLSGGGTVEYLDADRGGVNAVQTAEHGYFLSRNAPFGSTWTATDARGRHQNGSYQAGLLEGKVTALTIRIPQGR